MHSNNIIYTRMCTEKKLENSTQKHCFIGFLLKFYVRNNFFDKMFYNLLLGTVLFSFFLKENYEISKSG